VELAEKSGKFAHENGLDGSGALAVVPAPLSFKSFLLLLYRAATDPEVRLEPTRSNCAGTFRTAYGDVVYDVRPAGVRQVDGRRKLDYGDRLFHLMPGLRAFVRALRLTGHVPTITSE
jgi:hypothetical protein